MKLRRRDREQEKGAPKWMVTFSDLMTLILVFFILLFSMSQIDKEKFEAVAESFRSRAIFDFNPSVVDHNYPADQRNKEQDQKDMSEFESEKNDDVNKDQETGAKDTQDSLNNLVTEVETFLKNNDLTEKITANRTDRGVVLTLQEQVLFNTAEAEIIPNGQPFLKKVGQLLNNIPNHVKVEGHTDNRPISTYRFPSNWELSAARASGVIRYLAEETAVDAARFTAVGYGDTRPIVPNNSEENWQKNRRVEIVILDPNYEEKENTASPQ
ncbi:MULTISPECIES: flagellar motor protein MotS [Pontibacillus]|uniref:Flagellar motor protein MotS n=1 Tax=Pontibacillus chungwhensis TaxID=265426 RepID=A0ABY8UWY5_9BACI|nr:MULTISPECIES: flagellar motor protein MotS [Pontibacillus]MCD5323888.1 flagellar motor protein MotB [Pontibacillus sp. HN14]WIF97246.1 flagellar motor protein MotS [Pontibacillus chungwhensis]